MRNPVEHAYEDGAGSVKHHLAGALPTSLPDCSIFLTLASFPIKHQHTCIASGWLCVLENLGEEGGVVREWNI